MLARDHATPSELGEEVSHIPALAVDRMEKKKHERVNSGKTINYLNGAHHNFTGKKGEGAN